MYHYISRLVTMAYPDTNVALTTHVAKEAFLATLNDAQLQLEVMKREPQNVEQALSHAIKLEAYEQSLNVQSGTVADAGGSRLKRWPRDVCAVGDCSEAEETAALRKRVDMNCRTL